MFKREILIRIAELEGDTDMIINRLEALTKAIKKLEKTLTKDKNE